VSQIVGLTPLLCGSRRLSERSDTNALLARRKIMKFALQELQACPPKIARQIRGLQRTANLTNMPERWKEIAFSENAEDLLPFVSQARRVVNFRTLEVVAECNC
jgi:hypothetical protein